MAIQPPTQKQIEFTKHVASGMSARKAAVAAGYSVDVANRGMQPIAKQKALQQVIKEARIAHLDEIVNSVGCTREARLALLWDIALASKDNNKEIRTMAARVGISAVAEINKMCGDYAPDRSLRLTVDMTKEKMLEAKKVYSDF